MTFSSPEGTRLNADVNWDTFDPAAYLDHNYRYVQEEDAEILRLVRDHFAGHFRSWDGVPVSGIDVGTGANLCPALAMLPWCEEITLLEYSPANVAYLESQLDGIDENWDQFWQFLGKSPAYASLDMNWGERFREVVTVERGSLFDLAEHPGGWSLGTMFFVAESMTTSHAEFRWGVECFLRALVPGAPFAAVFMEHSEGYHAGEHFFPACDVGEAEIRSSIEPFAAHDLKIVRLQSQAAVRVGFSGMTVACGRRRS